MARPAYGWQYQRARAALLAAGLPCSLHIVCRGDPADSADHDPPLALHDHVAGSGCCVLRPACLRCQQAQGKQVAAKLRTSRGRSLPEPSRRW